MDCAAAWIAPNCPGPEATKDSRRTATRVTFGAISLSNSNHFPPIEYSKLVKPVTLPPGRARLDVAGAYWVSDKREHDRNCTALLQQRCDGRAGMCPRITSGASATNSAACLRMVSGLPAPQR